MQERWPLVGRDDELAFIAEHLLPPEPRSLVLSGAAGVGKTRLALESRALAERNGVRSAQIQASRSASTIPFGAFAQLLPPPEQSPEAKLTFLRRAATSIADSSDGHTVLLVVDDAHLLDEGSAALVHQIVQTEGLVALLTIRSGEPAPDATTLLWKDGLAERLEIQALSRTETEQLAREALGEEVDGAFVQKLWNATEGNPLYLRELLAGAIGSGDLILDGGVWRLAGRLGAPTQLIELIELRLASLSERDREFLELLAFDEQLELATLVNDFESKLLESLERGGFLNISSDDAGTHVRLGHPLYAEALRARMPTTRVKKVKRRLVDLIESSPARRRGDALRLALLRLESDGTAPPELLTDAAREAYFASDHSLAERLARAALEAGATWHTRRLLAEILRWAGKYEEAEHELSAIDMGLVSTDGERSLIAVTRAENLFRGLFDHSEAIRVLNEAERVISDPQWRNELRATIGYLDVLAGEVVEGLASAASIAEGAPSRAMVTASLASAYGLVASGKCEDAANVAHKGFSAAIALGPEEMVLPPGAQVVAQCLALVESGRLEQAEAVGRENYAIVVEQGILEGQGAFALILARALLLRGALRDAAHLYREAAITWRDIRDPGPQRAGWAGVAGVASALGDLAVADRALCELDSVHPAAFQLFEADVDRGRAAALAGRGEISRACAMLATSADGARTHGRYGYESCALHDIVRYGGAQDVHERLAQLTEIVQGQLVVLRAQHAAAAAAEDGDVLDRVATGFESIGATLLAAEAAAQASRAWQAAGRRRKSVAAAERARSLARNCDGVRTPALVEIDVGSQLTRREHEVANLAAQGLSSREIAERLVVSVRTVENHLQHVYEKLGVGSRSELARRLEN